MPIKYESTYKMTEKSKQAFKIWLVKNGLSMNAFAKNCGVSHSYISDVVNGKIKVTPTVIETFKKGGYELKQ